MGYIFIKKLLSYPALEISKASRKKEMHTLGEHN
jgi:hypothetical protein